MVLTDTQIERYSRQIIVPGVGGRAQERLLAARVAIVAAPAYAFGAVAYLAGAGVGRIVVHPVGDRAPYRAMLEQIGDLNPDVSVEIASDEMPEQCDLMLALIGDAPAAEAAARVAREHRCAAAIVARLDMPGRIALMPAPPPCPRCAEADLLSPPHDPASNAGAIAMVAVTEAFKLLAGFAGQQPEGRLIEFDGYVSRTRVLHRRRVIVGGEAHCACEAAAS
jgi:adenylyltransferase/sulfurtransferase